MVRFLSVLLITLAGINVSAQVVINVQLPASGMYLKNQLWNLSLVNAGETASNVRIEVLMTEVSTNQPVLSGISGIIQLKKGISQINALIASPISYNVLNPGYNVDANPNGFLPIGVFNICFRVIAVSEISERLAEECEMVEIEPMSPPELVLPFDSDTIEVANPVFVWLAPAPQGLINNVPLYDLKLVEVLPFQTSADAIQQNVPVYHQTSLTATAQPYPGSSPALDTAKLYAWQITLRNNVNGSLTKSEIWTFRVRKNAIDTAVINGGHAYSRLSRTQGTSLSIAKGALYFEYQNEVNEPEVNIRVYDVSNSRKTVPLAVPAIPVRAGQNLIQYNLQENGRFIHKHIYLFEIVNGRNESWYVKFEYRKPQ